MRHYPFKVSEPNVSRLEQEGAGWSTLSMVILTATWRLGAAPVLLCTASSSDNDEKQDDDGSILQERMQLTTTCKQVYLIFRFKVISINPVLILY